MKSIIFFCKGVYASKQTQLENLKTEEAKWLKKLESHKDLEEKKNNLNTLRHELASSMLNQAVEEWKIVCDTMTKFKREISNCQDIIDKEETDKDALKNEKNDIEFQKTKLEGELEMYEEEVKEIQNDIKTVKTEQKQLLNNFNALNKKKSKFNTDIKAIEDAISKGMN